MVQHHWQSAQHKTAGVDDMVLLSRLSDDAIVENLKKRLQASAIFTYIGPVLISVNPFKELGLFGDHQMDQYQGSAQYENPPHIYAIADHCYRDMVIDAESQCVIISGESGAGKTVAAKHIMNYLAKTAGGGQNVQHVKDVILSSNPLLEAFGNAATTRNWNSSRFGKYVQIAFRSGQPTHGEISNFLLEKSRVVYQASGERNFHIFYQLCAGADAQMKNELGVTTPDYYHYLNMSGCSKIHDTDDAKEFRETLKALTVVGVSSERTANILKCVAAVLHLGNIRFVENNNYAAVANEEFLDFPAFLLGVDKTQLQTVLTTRKMESKWGRQTEQIDVTLTTEQADYTRDALSKALYSRLFDHLVAAVNEGMVNRTASGNETPTTIGILDIYGFEIFEHNAFEQFCINFVNEKLQQIFIELTLKAEQEEYVNEGIHWQPIEYFNNKVVCDLIESKRPPGIMCILDDSCAQMHAQREGVDEKFLQKMNQQLAGHEHLAASAASFVIKHYAGNVKYEVAGFCDKNRDLVHPDLVLLLQSSSFPFVRALFPERVTTGHEGPGPQTRQTSAGAKIRTQANDLVASLMRCTPHYVRCIKPNETKRAMDWDDTRVRHQVEYLGLRENIRVRRAGFAYRRPFDRFLHRYAILSEQTWPHWRGNPQQGCEIICRTMNLDPDQYQMGRSKIFIKNPESLFMLEEQRERRYDAFARTIQKAWRAYIARRHYAKQKEAASDLLYGKKERRRYSLHRNFVGDYIGLDERPALRMMVGKRERVDFAAQATKYDRRWKVSKLDILVTPKALWMIGREKATEGPQKGQLIEVVKRQIDFANIQYVGLSPFQDDFMIIAVKNDHSTPMETPFKTELLTAMSKRYKERTGGGQLPLVINSQHQVVLKKTRFGGGTRTVAFNLDPSGTALSQVKPNGKTLLVSVGPGLPNTTRPSTQRPKDGYARRSIRRGRPNNNEENGAAHTPTVGRTNAPARPAPPSHQSMANSQPRQPQLMAYQEPPRVIQPAAPAHQPQSNGNSGNGGRTGFVPPSDAFRLPGLGGGGGGGGHLGGGGATVAPAPSKPRPAPKPRLALPTVKALYAYDAQDTDELSFGADQIIEVVQKDESGWWQGRIGAQSGLFPSNYVEECS